MAYIPMKRPTFEAALRDVCADKRDMRLAAAEALSSPPEGRAAEAAEALAMLADDRDAAVRQSALMGLGHVDGQAHLDLVLARFDDGEPFVREAAVITAGRLGGPDAESAIRDALSSTYPEVRFQAVMSIVELAPDDAAESIAALLRDDDPEVRAHAAEALGKLSDPSVADALASLLDDEEKLPRYEAALALAALDDGRGASVLRDALAAPETAIAAAMALGDIRDHGAREALAAIAKKRILSPLMRAAVGGALCRLEDARGITALRAAMHALRADGRGLAIQIVGDLGLRELADDLVILSRRPRGADPVVIAQALGRLAADSPAAKEALVAMAESEDPEGSAAAREALA